MTEDEELAVMVKAAMERNEPRVKANIDPETGVITFEGGSMLDKKSLFLCLLNFILQINCTFEQTFLIQHTSSLKCNYTRLRVNISFNSRFISFHGSFNHNRQFFIFSHNSSLKWG